MIRPALTSLLALAVALPALPLMADEAAPNASRCSPLLKAAGAEGTPVIMIPAGSDKWENDLQAANPLCDDAVWRMVDAPGLRAKWGSTAPQQAELLGKVAAALEQTDKDTLELETAAGKVYEAAKAANLIKANTQSDVKIKRASFKSNVLTPNDAPTQFDSADRDKAAALLAQRGQAMAQLAVAGTPVKGAKPGVAAPAQPGPLVLAYFQALDKVRADAAAASALGVTVPRVTPLIAPSTKNLSDNYRDAMKALAFADKWDDQAAHTSALDALQDRALRNRVALNSANVEAVYQEARKYTGTSRAGADFIDKKKKEDIDKLNAQLRAKVNAAIGYDGAKQAFDGDVAHNGDYADTEEGRYRANELAGAKAMADTAEIAARADGKGYQLQYKTADGQVHVVQGKENIPDLKTAQSSLDDLTSSLASKILADHKMLAKTQAAVEAAKSGATSFGEAGPGAPMGPVAVSAGCDKKGESLDEYKKRLRDQQMEGSADASAKRQGPLKAYKDALQAADEQYKNNVAYMKPEQAAKIRDNAKAKAKQDYIAATQALGSMDDDIAARTARVSSINEVAQASFVENIKRAAPQLATGMKSHLKKYVPEGAARALVVEGGSDDGKTTLFDQFIAEEWTFGQGNLSQNAESCKDGYREGDYGSLEQCAGKTLKAWLAKRKPGKADNAPSVDDQVRETERSR